MNTKIKKVNLELVGLDGNAFSIIGAFSLQAEEEKWTKKEINTVLDEALSGDYNHLLVTIMKHCNTVDSQRARPPIHNRNGFFG